MTVCTGHVDNQRAATEILIPRSIDCQSLDPVIAGSLLKIGPGSKQSLLRRRSSRSLESVIWSNERIHAVAGDAANGPYSPASDAGGPCCYAGRIIYRHANQPATIVAMIRETPIWHIKNVAYHAERRSLQLDRCSERHPVVRSCRLHVNGPAGICVARI